jgi:aryl-alcohol dehydrogenase-like predicted oxidoreductase
MWGSAVEDRVVIDAMHAALDHGINWIDTAEAYGDGASEVDAVDLYRIHWPAEHEVPVEETWGAMSELVAEGLVRHIGVSNFDRPLIERCLAIRHVDSVQNPCFTPTIDESCCRGFRSRGSGTSRMDRSPSASSEGV